MVALLSITKCELRVTSGAREGHREIFEKSYIGVGRHPLSDLRFDAEKDLDASTRHAAIVKNGDNFVLRDLGSTNGTFVNGERMTQDRILHHGDIMKFGLHGPEVMFTLIREEEEVVMPAVQAPPPRDTGALPPKPPTSKTTPETPVQSAPPKKVAPKGAGPDDRTADMAAKAAPPSKTSVLRAEVGAQRSRARTLMLVLGIVLIGALATVYWQGKTSSEQIGEVVRQVDSLTNVLAVLQRAREQNDSIRAALQREIRAEVNPQRVQVLRSRLSQATQRDTAIQQAQAVDFGTIQANNSRAIAVIAVRFPDTTQMWEGTAFSVNTSGLLVTNKHLVVSRSGEQARDIAVRFHGSTDVLPARIVRMSPDADLAILQIESDGPFPAISGMEQQMLPVGAPIALIGYPGGCGACTAPRAKLNTGSVTVFTDSIIEMDAFSGTGASGSPIFDKNGRVIGVLYGGRGGSSSNEIVGLPIRRAMTLLNTP